MRALGFNLHRVGGDAHFLFHVADSQVDVDAQLIIHLQDDVGCVELLEAWDRGVHPVGAGRQCQKVIGTIITGHGVLGKVGLGVRHRHAYSLDHGLRGIAHHAEDRAGDVGEQKA